jgi:hypothetical protein
LHIVNFLLEEAQRGNEEQSKQTNKNKEYTTQQFQEFFSLKRKPAS